MSRWVEEFEAHPFQQVWRDFMTTLESATIDDKTVTTAVAELARLRKVAFYIDEMIKSIDPEIVPMSTWTTFQGQATPCLQQVQAYNSNRNISHIKQANAHADNLLTYVRPYMVAAGKVAKVLQEAVKGYAKTIDEYAESFRNKSNELLVEIKEHAVESKELFDSTESTKNEIDQYHVELFGAEEPDGGIQSKVNELVDDFESKHGKIVEYYNETFVGDAHTESTLKEIEQAKESIIENKGQIKVLLEDVSSEVNDLAKFHIKIFGKENKEGVQEGGLAGELNVRTKALSDFEAKQKDRYEALNEQIERLLPGATSAGLATAYLDMKKSFDAPIKHASTVFYVAIGALIFASVLLAIDSVSWTRIDFVDVGNWDLVLKSVVNKIPFYVPILWLAFYASKRRSEYQRLQQEYAHKEALAKSYDNYKKQIEDLDEKDLVMQKAFIMKAIDAIAYNASNTLDGKHGDKMPSQDVIEKAIDEMAKLKNFFKTGG